MAKISIVAGATSQSVNIFIQDSSSTVGAGLSGLVFNTSSLIAYYTFAGANATSTQITLATLAAVNSAYSSGGFKEIDSTNMKGLYRLDIPNAALATSKGQSVAIMLGGATNMAPCVLEVELTGWNNQDGVHGGMTALPNAAAGASGGLIINGSNSGAITLAATTISGLTLTGAAAVTSTPGTAGLTITGGAASTTSGGTAAAGIVVTGGAGAASTNGAASGATFAGGGTNTVSSTADGVTFTATSNGNGITGAHAGTGKDFNVTTTALTALPTVAPGAANGLLIAGTNAATTFSAGLTISQSTSNTAGLIVSGNGTGAAATFTGGATGAGAKFIGGGTSGDGIDITTTSGDGLSILPTAGNGIIVTANGTSKHGIVSTGGTAGTSDGVKAVAGTGGVDLRANLTGNVTGNLSGSVGSVTGNVGGNVVGSVASVTGNVGGNVTGSVGSVASGGISRASFTADSGLQTVRSNTATAGAASTITLDASASATNNFYQYDLIYLTGGTGAGQAAYIASYVGSTQVATIEGTWITNPDATTTFAIIPRSQVVVGTNNDKTGYALSATGFNTFSDASNYLNSLTFRQTLNGIFLGLPLSKRSGLTNDGSAASILVRDVADTKNAISVSTDGHGNISTTPTFNL